jgi:hypothetical protein
MLGLIAEAMNPGQEMKYNKRKEMKVSCGE